MSASALLAVETPVPPSPSADAPPLTSVPRSAPPVTAAAGGGIAGTVVADGSGTPLAGICVYPFPASGGSNVGSATTAADGTYLLSGLAPGGYKVRFQDCVGSVDYAAEFFDDTTNFGAATVVSVSEGVTTSGVNAGLAIGGRLAGTVVADGSAAPLASICVGAPNASTGSSMFRVNTAADGTYTITGLAPGTYKVKFEDCNSPYDYATEYYDNKPDFNSGNTVSVNAGATTSGINASMAPGGSISGTVVADGSGTPLAGICAYPYPLNGGSNIGSATTAADGTYLLTGLPVTSYRVRFQDCVGSIDYAVEYYNNQIEIGPANPVPVSAGTTTSGINASMALGGRISGTVVADGTGAPLSGICVYAPFSVSNSTLFRVTTGADGTYMIAGMAGANYKVRFEDCVEPLDYATEHYDNKPEFTSATTVTVTAGATVSGINAGLAIAGRIAGTVAADGSGTPLSGICIDASLPTSGFVARATSAADGTYIIPGLAARSYKVRFEDCVSPVDYAAEYYDNKPDFGSANTVAVSAGATTAGINAGLAIGGRIAGTVVADGSGNPLSGICVSPFSTATGSGLHRGTTGADGSYVIAGVAVGTYRVKFEDCVSPIDYAAEYYDNTLDANAANAVTVNAGATTSGINAGLAIGGRISGTVVADGSGPLSGICVSTFNVSTNVSLFRISTGGDGTYVVAGLAAGSYKVRFQSCVSPAGFVTEYYDDKRDYSSANPVSVTAGATTSGISASMAPLVAKKPADFDGDGDSDRSVYRNGAWYAESQATAFIGTATDIPVPGDYDNDGRIDRAVYRDGTWFTEGQPTAFLGLSGDVPVPGDYNGDGRSERAVYRPSVGAWYVEGQPAVFFGNSSDIPVPGDYDGNGTTDIAVFRPSVGGWYVDGQPTVFSGLSGDIPVPGDYDASGTTDKAVFRPSVGGWYTAGQTTVFTGLSGDIPVPGDYDGDGDTDRAIWRKAVGGWYTSGQATVFLGLSGDIPLPLPQAIYRNFFTP